MITYAILSALAALIALVLKTAMPGFPFDATQILAALVFVLGLFGVVVEAPFRRLVFFGVDGWLKSKAFWLLVAGALNIVLHSYVPTFPLLEADLVALIFWFLELGGIVPEVKELKLRFAKLVMKK